MTAIQVLRRTNVSTTEDLSLGFPLPGLEPSQAGKDDAAGRPTGGEASSADIRHS
jgi:hypothetical protein